ncbi:MAG TPA: fused MFS/spermidine synthase [Candidatus Acidoferrales bacterium]|nr:fused MFS/spermidine synthase [Candidatus Acidoferrales bacterium]
MKNAAAKRFAGSGLWPIQYLGIHSCFFLSGATAMVFEILWSRRFVTVFGNSSYAVSIVLCAFMAGLGLGGLIGGRLADRLARRLLAFGLIEFAIAALALAMPVMLNGLQSVAPALASLTPGSLLTTTLARFALSFAILVVPCFLMGVTLPLLVRAVTNSGCRTGASIGALYSWNTLGAAFGCLAAGFWMLETLGLRLTNFCAVAINILIGLAAIAIPDPAPRETEPALKPSKRSAPDFVAPAKWLLTIAFVNGLAGLICEVVWFRYLAFIILERPAYAFPAILCVYLLGIGLGSFAYSLLAGRIKSLPRALGIIEVLLGVSVLATFVTGAWLFALGPPRPFGVTSLAFITVLLPTALMGMAFPALCSLYGSRLGTLGRSVGLLYAVNTAGTVAGSLLPVFVLVPLLGIQRSLLLAALFFGAMGLLLLARRAAPLASVFAAVVALFLFAIPPDLCQRVFLATGFNLSGHTDLLFFREGRSGTSVVTRDRVNGSKAVYINANPEVPVLYADQICFKMLGDLGPMLHPHPDDVLMICLGGGIAAGAASVLPEVKSLTVVDLESSVVDAARLLSRENNDVLLNSKTRVVIEDGRNYVMTSRRQWPVIITDSTHPKTSDSWVLYTREFYESVRSRLTDDGVFVQWVPLHGLSLAEYKTILRTSASVFPHVSLWVSGGVEEQGQFVNYSLLVATPRRLNIDVPRLQERLKAESVRNDLAPYGLDSVAGFLGGFVCAEDSFRSWVGEGRINTDDLPLTYYTPPGAPPAGSGLSGFFFEPMEDIWPCLSGASDLLHRELALRARANCLLFSGRPEQAFPLLPSDLCYQTMRRFFEIDGPRYFDALIQSNWNNPNALVYLADIRVSFPDGLRAVRPVYDRALSLDPDNVPALAVLGGLDAESGESAEAENLLRHAVRLDARSVSAQYNLAVFLDNTDRHSEALEHYEKAATDAGDSTAADAWGGCLAQQGHNAEAIHWFQQAVDLCPTEIRPRLHLAYVLGQTGRTREALAQVQCLLKLDPGNPTFLTMAADLEKNASVQPDRLPAGP